MVFYLISMGLIFELLHVETVGAMAVKMIVWEVMSIWTRNGPKAMNILSTNNINESEWCFI